MNKNPGSWCLAEAILMRKAQTIERCAGYFEEEPAVVNQFKVMASYPKKRKKRKKENGFPKESQAHHAQESQELL